MFAFRIAGGAGAVAVRSICSIRACVCVFQRDCKASYRTRNVSIARASPRISASASHLWHAVDRSRVRCPFCLPSLTYHVLVMNVRASVHSLLVAGLMVNASHEAMDEHADFARTRAAHQTVASYFATSEGQIGLERPAGLLLRYARREVRGHLRLHSRFSASVPKTLVRALLMEC